MNRGLQVLIAAGVYLGGAAAVAHAHEVAGISPANWWRAWSWEPAVVTGLIFAGAVYASGVHWLRVATRVRRKMRFEAACFWSGWIVLVIALVSPLHPLGGELFAAHMVQHELLMVVAAPLLVLGRPDLACWWAVPRNAARAARRGLGRFGRAPAWRWTTSAFTAWLVHAMVLWGWHVPACFDASVSNRFVHACQHASFLGAAMWFWHALFFGRPRALRRGAAILYLFTTALHTGALGALITLARVPWYSSYAATTEVWGFTPLQDQQLGGLIMWIPAGLAYIVAALMLFAGALRAPPRTPELIQSRPTCAPAL